ncbi:MAG: polymer-forming cytoskeletal protein [Spirochaetales bacterium]|nr:polymer-forming cytoskeletal protein [Spirochaetales bacterium]
MIENRLPDGTFINSIIGEGTKFTGEFDLNGLLRIDGDFTGVIRTKGKVLVGSNGRVECTMYAGTVVVGGIVRGDIYSTEKVIILSTGMVIGNIQSPRLIVEEGVLFHGTCLINPDVDEQAQQRKLIENNHSGNRENHSSVNRTQDGYLSSEKSRQQSDPLNESVSVSH